MYPVRHSQGDSIHNHTLYIMHKRINPVVMAMATFLLAACSQDEFRRISPKDNIVATIQPASTTRTAVDSPADGQHAVGIVWTEGDQIGVFDADATAQRCYANASGRSAKANFTPTGEAFAEPKFAYYPYDHANDGNPITALQGTLPATQNMDSGVLHGDYKYGRAQGSGPNGHEFAFAHLFSVARVTIDAEGTPLAGDVLKGVRLTLTRGTVPVAVAGDFTFNARNGVWQQKGEVQNCITMEWTDGTTLSQAVRAYTSLFPNVKAGDTFTIEVLTQNYRASFSAQSLVDFERETIYTLPLSLKNYESLQVFDQDGNQVYPSEETVTGTFTCATLNVDGLLNINYVFGHLNPDGPGASGTTKMGQIVNSLGWDFLAVSEDFEYNDELVSAMTRYESGTYRGTISSAQLTKRADTDGLNFFWKKGMSEETKDWVQFTAEEGGLTGGANTCIKKGFRHYVVTVADGVEVDVYITHMNTYSGDGNTEESNAYVKAVLSQLRQLRDYVLAKMKENKRPAIIMGDTNMRYTRHQIVDNFFTPVAQAGYTAIDPWVKFHRGGVFPTWGGKSLMIRSKFAGDTTNDICCSDDQRGEVVDKVWYINCPESAVQLEATDSYNDVENFTKSSETAKYDGVTTEDANGNILEGQSVNYTKYTGLGDHFPVVVNFKYTYKKSK